MLSIRLFLQPLVSIRFVPGRIDLLGPSGRLGEIDPLLGTGEGGEGGGRGCQWDLFQVCLSSRADEGEEASRAICQCYMHRDGTGPGWTYIVERPERI
jgi:hypothetical protein